MHFKYTVLNEENRQMTGVMEADSLDLATEELHRMNLSILVINNISEGEYQQEKLKEEEEMGKSGVKIYKFKAIDQRQKEINGTIDAKDPYNAFKRLTVSYHFRVNALYPENATPEEQEVWQQEFLKNIDKWKEQMDEEGVDFEKTTRVTERNKDLQEERVIDQKVVDEIDQFIINTKRVLSVHGDQFSASFLAEIQKVLGELERVRTSNNMKHITEICNELYELVSHPDQITSDMDHTNRSEYLEILHSMKSSGFIRAQFDLETRTAGLKNIQHHFEKILRKITGKKKSGGEEIKRPSKIQKFLRKVSKHSAKKRKNEEEQTRQAQTGIKEVISNAFAYISAPSPILRQTRKQEMLRAFHEWHQSITKTLMFYRIKATIKKTGKASKFDISDLAAEVNGFIGWLLFFYILYFFLVDFSLEKGVGLPRGFVIKTLKTDLVLNVVIFLVMSHFFFKLKNQFFRRSFFGSAFLFSLGLAFYVLLIINF